jgi:hypothetical protein
MVELLQAAVIRYGVDPDLLVRFSTLPSAQQLGSQELGQVLKVTVKHQWAEWYWDCLRALLRLPLAKRLAAGDIASFLWEMPDFDGYEADEEYEEYEEYEDAMRSSWAEIMCMVCESIPAMKQLSGEEVVGLVEAFWETSDRECTLHDSGLLGLPVAQGMDGGVVAGLLKALLGTMHGWHGEVEGQDHDLAQLLRLPGAQQMDTGALVEVLQVAVGRGLDTATAALLKLPAAGGLSVEQLEALVCCAIEGSKAVVLPVLLQLPIAQQLSGDAVTDLLRGAMTQGCSLGVEALVELPGAQQISQGTLFQLMKGWAVEVEELKGEVKELKAEVQELMDEYD